MGHTRAHDDEILAFIGQSPGATVARVSRALGLPNRNVMGSLLKRLTDEGRLTRWREPNAPQTYLYSVPAVPQEPAQVAPLPEINQEVLDFLGRYPGANVERIATGLRVSDAVARKRIKPLFEQGLVVRRSAPYGRFTYTLAPQQPGEASK